MPKRSTSPSDEEDDDDVVEHEDINPTPSSSRSFDVHASKYTHLSSPSHSQAAVILRCALPPHHPLTFTSQSAYSTHYAHAHTNRCSACHSNFPTPHALSLHLGELHDPLLAYRREAGEKTFACLVEGCEKVCRDWKKRRSHLVDKHGFPRNYDFLVVEHGVEGRRTLLRPGVDARGHRRSSREGRQKEGREGQQGRERRGAGDMEAEDVQSEDEEASDADTPATEDAAEVVAETAEGRSTASGAMDDLTSGMSSLKMVPRSVTFGRRKGRTGFAKS